MRTAKNALPGQCTLVLLAVLTFTNNARSQGLAQQDLLPPVGATWHMQALQNVPADELPIEPITWAYGNLVGNDLFGATFTVRLPSQSPGNAAYPLADRAVRSVPDNGAGATHTYYEVRSDACHELGSVGPVITTHFDPSAVVLAYPMPDGGSISGDLCYTASSIGDTTDLCGTARISHEATGVLELPYGTFPNAHLLVTRRATAVAHGGLDSTILVTKDWYVAGIPFPLLHITVLNAPDGSVTRTGQLLDEAAAVGIEGVVEHALLPVFPNPSAGVVTVNAPGEGALEVCAMDGRTILAERIVAVGAPTTIDLAGFAEGVYLVTFRNAVSIRTARVIIAR